jgi:mRNA interferase RelE/StbE
VYSVEFTREATKALALMPGNLRIRLLTKLDALARDPFGAPQVKKLVGQPGYRLRVGDWRVIYDLEAERLVVRVLRVAPRGGVYE